MYKLCKINSKCDMNVCSNCVIYELCSSKCVILYNESMSNKSDNMSSMICMSMRKDTVMCSINSKCSMNISRKYRKDKLYNGK